MTKILKKSAYPVKIPVRKDYFVGTDGENNGKTVNFDFESTAKLINELNGTPILNYIFKTDNNIPLAVLTEGVFLSEGNETTVSNISKLYINKKNFHEEDMSDLFRFIAVNREVFIMKLRNSSNLANGVYFRITDATEFENHFILDVAIELSNTAVPELVNFNLYFFDFELNSSNLAITLPEFNKIVTQTGYTSTETTITFNPFWTWLIKNVSYENSASVVKTIATATTGKKRIDVFVLNTSNTFETISGAETTGSPVKPQIPTDTLEVTFCIVGDSGIETVEPIDLSAYATRQYVDDKDDLKVDKVIGKSLLLDTEITRLATLSNFDDTVIQSELDSKLAIADYNQHFKGVYLTEAALITAHPTASVGDYAQVNEVGSTDVVNYNWDAEENIWVKNIVAGSGATNTDSLPEGTTNLYFTTARVLAVVLSGLSLATGGTIVSTDTVLVAFGKLQKQISDNLTAIGLKADINSPALTGTPTAPTATLGTSTTQIATTAFVNSEISLKGYWTKTGNDITNNNSGKVLIGGSSLDLLNKDIVNISYAYANNFEGGQLYIYNGARLTGSLGVLISDAPIRPAGYTVATLPAGVQGAHAYVTDATAPTYLGTLTGGGSVKCPVFYNGSAWVSH